MVDDRWPVNRIPVVQSRDATSLHETSLHEKLRSVFLLAWSFPRPSRARDDCGALWKGGVLRAAHQCSFQCVRAPAFGNVRRRLHKTRTAVSFLDESRHHDARAPITAETSTQCFAPPPKTTGPPVARAIRAEIVGHGESRTANALVCFRGGGELHGYI